MISISTSRGMVVGVSSSRRGHSSGGNWAEKLASCLVLSFLKLSRNNLSPNSWTAFHRPSVWRGFPLCKEKLTVLFALFSGWHLAEGREGSKGLCSPWRASSAGWPQAGHARLPAAVAGVAGFLGNVLSPDEPEAGGADGPRLRRGTLETGQVSSRPGGTIYC